MGGRSEKWSRRVGIEACVGLGKLSDRMELAPQTPTGDGQPVAGDRLNGIVEVDETYVGDEKAGKRDRGAAGKAQVVIAAEIDGPRMGGRIRLRRVADGPRGRVG